MKDVANTLKSLYADNFVLYYKAHAFHFNVQGSTFAQDHALLEEIYTFLWEQHDILGEQIRQLDKPVVASLAVLLNNTALTECEESKNTNAAIFKELSTDIQSLLTYAQYLYKCAGECDCGGLETLIGDYLKALSKLHWKVKATLGVSIK
jgi:starvation-inducible DNA-binding protein